MSLIENVKGGIRGIAKIPTKSTFLQDGKLTPDEFVEAGNRLKFKCPCWQWAPGDPQKALSYLPPEKQFLSIMHIPYRSRVSNVTDQKEEALSGESDEWVAAGEKQETKTPAAGATVDKGGDDYFDFNEVEPADPYVVTKFNCSTSLLLDSHSRPQGLDAPTSCPYLQVGHLKTKKAQTDANQDHSKNARQFSGLDTLQTHTQGTNSNHAVDMHVSQLDLDVFQSDRQLAPTVATNALIQRTAPLSLVQGQLVQILEGITRAPLQETDFYATNMPNKQVLEVMQRAARAPQLLQHTEIPAADKQLLPPLHTIDALASGFQLQTLQFWEIGILTIQHILEGNLIVVIDTVSGLVLALRQAERANMARIRLFSMINAYLFDGNNNSVMSHANLATTQRQIGIQQLTSGQNVANVQGNLIGVNVFLNLQAPQRRGMLTPAQITNNFLLGINTKSEQQTQQSQISQAPSQGPVLIQFQQNLQLQQQPLSLNRDLFNTATQLLLILQNSIPPDLSVNRQQQISPIFPVIQNPQQQGADSEGSQTQRQNIMARNFHTVMENDMESVGRDMNPPPLEAKINQPTFNRQRDYWARKSYLLKYIGKAGAGQHLLGYGDGQIEVQEVILRQARGDTISIVDWRKFWKELDTDLKLDAIRLQSPVSDSEEQDEQKDQSSAFWNNPRERYRQEMISDCKVGDKEEEEEVTEEGVIEEIEAVVIDIIDHVAPWPPAQTIPATSSNTIVLDLSQKKLVIQLPNQQELLTLGNQKKTPYISTSQSSKTTRSNIIPIPTTSVHQIQQEQDHLLHRPVAVYQPLINPSIFELPPVVNTQPNNMNQPVNTILVSQQQVQNQRQLTSRSSQLLVKHNYVSSTYEFQRGIGSSETSQLDDTTREQGQEKYLILMQQRAQNQAQKFLMDGMIMNLEARSKGFDNLLYHPFGNFQPSFCPNQYIDYLSKIPSQDQQEYSNELDQYQMQRDDDHDSNDDVFEDADLVELQVRGRRGRGKKNRGRGKAQSQTQPLLFSHQPIQESTQSKLKVPGQRRGKTGAANGTINPSAQSSRIKQITGGSNFNFGSSMDIDMEQMMERDLTQTQSTTNDGPIVSIVPQQLAAASWHVGGETIDVFASQRSNIQHLNDRNEMNIPQQCHLAAQSAYGLRFLP
ncbi:MAG: hypothetical protein EZS28_016213 [Streblomastix strix]|uniref:Uncharacterized protein n=1 Tax=Streblomastix strix TaxID=222440 RepID=A0A5J4W007_9EUKA|nr:MAG: hypothetical protein EZS28_016213 [Streblomastix strix]